MSTITIPLSGSKKIVFNSEAETSSKPATVQICEEGIVLSEVQAIIEQKQGADGDFYPCVTFSEISAT